MSSSSMAAARWDMFRKILFWSSVEAPIRAFASSCMSVSRNTFRMALSSRYWKSSKQNRQSSIFFWKDDIIFDDFVIIGKIHARRCDDMLNFRNDLVIWLLIGLGKGLNLAAGIIIHVIRKVDCILRFLTEICYCLCKTCDIHSADIIHQNLAGCPGNIAHCFLDHKHSLLCIS